MNIVKFLRAIILGEDGQYHQLQAKVEAKDIVNAGDLPETNVDEDGEALIVSTSGGLLRTTLRKIIQTIQAWVNGHTPYLDENNVWMVYDSEEGEFTSTGVSGVGPQGESAESAYQAAVAAGYTGTQAQFNAALTSLNDAPFLPLSGGSMTGAINMGRGSFNNAEHVALCDRFDAASQDWSGIVRDRNGRIAPVQGSSIGTINADSRFCSPTPELNDDVANKKYVDDAVSGAPFLPLSGGTIGDASNGRILLKWEPALGYGPELIGPGPDHISLTFGVDNYGFYLSPGVGGADVSAPHLYLIQGIHGVTVTGLELPNDDTDAASKEYVDAAIAAAIASITGGSQ